MFAKLELQDFYGRDFDRKKNWMKHKYLTTSLYLALTNDTIEIFNAMKRWEKLIINSTQIWFTFTEKDVCIKKYWIKTYRNMNSSVST